MALGGSYAELFRLQARGVRLAMTTGVPSTANPRERLDAALRDDKSPEPEPGSGDASATRCR